MVHISRKYTAEHGYLEKGSGGEIKLIFIIEGRLKNEKAGSFHEDLGNVETVLKACRVKEGKIFIILFIYLFLEEDNYAD